MFQISGAADVNKMNGVNLVDPLAIVGFVLEIVSIAKSSDHRWEVAISLDIAEQLGDYSVMLIDNEPSLLKIFERNGKDL